MPIKIPDQLPARTVLEHEGVEIISQESALRQDVRPLKILLLNLMPKKKDTEIQFARLLSNTPLQIELTLMTTASYQPQNTSADYLLQFYRRLPEVRDEYFDALIVTGAPVEKIDYEKVDYWSELTEIIDWSERHVLRRLGICWGAQALLYHLHGIEKVELPEKLFGVYNHVLDPGPQRVGLLAGFTDRFPMPVSRFTGNRAEDIAKIANLSVLASSPETDVALVLDDATKDVFVLNHLEYDAGTLADEYARDLRAGLGTKLPVNYFPNDDSLLPPVNRWRTHAFLLFANWVKDLYHDAPFDISKLPIVRRGFFS
jgi:homoserine O-succinyltransferase